jgi:two-component system, cell cycle response regulator
MVKVLVAEDDPITSHLLQALLVKAGYEPILVESGLEVLRTLEQPDAPRLMILDWMIPQVDGVEVCRTIRKDTSRDYMYLILLTAKGKPEEVIEGFEAGADDYITKPFDFHELMARLRAGKRIVDLQDRLVTEATRDSLTGLHNRGAILDILRKESGRALRNKSSLAVIMADFDRFKQINDTYGHLAGDAVLKEVAQRMLASIRSYDSLGRYGGEEFLIVVPECGQTEAAHLAERLGSTIRNTAIDTPNSSLRVTMSFGVADVCAGQTPDELLRAADVALYAAKKHGRDRVEAYSEIEAPSS